MPNTTATAPSVAVHRVEIRSRPGMPDPKGDAAVRSAATLGLPEPPRQVHHAAVYLIEGALTDEQLEHVARDLLADPVTQAFTVGEHPRADGALIEVLPLPGVSRWCRGQHLEHFLRAYERDAAARSG
jgi:phosphoribosylformylglycinamidine (FGAM) synthase PurS component